MHAFAGKHADRFERRRLAGCAVDGHGDLHLQHLWFERDDGDPIAIDCLEFSEPLRRIDAAAEVAFPAMDLRYRGVAAEAERFLRVYARERDDFDLYAVVDFFASYRAAVRAKVASIAVADAAIDPAAARTRLRERAQTPRSRRRRRSKRTQPGRSCSSAGSSGPARAPPQPSWPMPRARS